MKKLLFSILCCSALQGCSSPYSTSGENLYLQSRNGPSMDVPPPLTRANLSSFYVLPPQSNPNPLVSIEPPLVSRSEE